MKILSIETSCDDTGISVLEVKNTNIRHGARPDEPFGQVNVTFEILADALSSQTKIHSPYGGVYPMLAKREHIKNLPLLLKKILKKAKLENKTTPVNMIAVTSGPGLEPSLWTGITFAKELAEKWEVPVIPVNHMEGHILSVFGKTKGKFTIPKINFPVLSLLVSGGHTELVLMKDFMKYKVIGETLDDAAGEAFDKVARMLGLPYPGGPEISRLAEKLRAEEKQSLRGVSQADGPRGSAPRARGDSDPEMIGFSIALPRPMLHSKNFDFSFSGLKTAVLYLTQKIAPLDDKKKTAVALEFENAVVETLVHKTKKAIEKYKIKTLIVAGGVSANTYLRKEMRRNLDKKIQILFPDKKLSRDNAIMIGIAGFFQFRSKKIKKKNIKAEGYLRL